MVSILGKGKRKSRSKKMNILGTAKKFMRVGAWLAPEALAIASNPTLQGALTAMTMKAGYSTGQFNWAEALNAWLPGLTYEMMDALIGLAKRTVKSAV